ncbi:MAG: LysR family transcriptional regulator [Sneathiella sp.]|nr:LysR family transcriptional regulator [Sneathiella sp.]
MTDIRQLRQFIAVAEEKHFRIAAERLNMTQPPLSHSIRKLEEELGVLLFSRTKKKVALTPVGEVFLRGAYETVNKLAQLESDTKRAAAGMIGRLKLGFVGSAIFEALPSTVRKFRSAYPDVELQLDEISTINQIAALKEGRIDAGLLRPPIPADGLFDIIKIRTEPLIAVIPESHPLSAKKSINLAELADDGFIIFSHDTSPNLHTLVMLACREAGFTPSISQTAPQIQTQISLVSAGLGVTLVPKCAQNITYPGVLYKTLNNPGKHVETSMAIARQRDNQNTLLDAFIQICRSSDNL